MDTYPYAIFPAGIRSFCTLYLATEDTEVGQSVLFTKSSGNASFSDIERRLTLGLHQTTETTKNQKGDIITFAAHVLLIGVRPAAIEAKHLANRYACHLQFTSVTNARHCGYLTLVNLPKRDSRLSWPR